MLVHGWNITSAYSTATHLQAHEGHTRVKLILSGFLIVTLAGNLTAAAAGFLDLDCGLGVDSASGSDFAASPGVGVGSLTLTVSTKSRINTTFKLQLLVGLLGKVWITMYLERWS